MKSYISVENYLIFKYFSNRVYLYTVFVQNQRTKNNQNYTYLQDFVSSIK